MISRAILPSGETRRLHLQGLPKSPEGLRLDVSVFEPEEETTVRDVPSVLLKKKQRVHDRK